MKAALVAALAAAGLALAGCGSSAPSVSSGSANSAGAPSSESMPSMTMSMSAPSSAVSMPATTMPTGESVIHIKDFDYNAVTVSPGATVTVHNMDEVAHTVTSDQSGLFNVKVPAGGTVTFKAPMQPGQYAYHCLYHANMHGTLSVS